uniref:glycosyltransferase family 25 protein n=1 Tax=Ruegeria arenilitoris TaxID=1173585 RepID=UPI00147CC040|nr:glycosyltransferase family 25 protein [Ruegeria arenilitoris]
MRSFVIHMSSSTARRPNAEQLCADLPNAELIEAVDGRDPAQIAAVTLHPGNLHRPRYPFLLKSGEIGCFESHRRVWKKIVADNVDIALIAEDDLCIDKARFSKAIQFLSQGNQLNSFIRIPVKQNEHPRVVLAAQDELMLILPKIVGLKTTCQVVGRKAAERLLAATDQIDRPVDTFLQMHWITGQPVHALLGSGNREVAGEIGGSTIQTKPPLTDKLTREFKRAAYRAQLHLHPQRPA